MARRIDSLLQEAINNNQQSIKKWTKIDQNRVPGQLLALSWGPFGYLGGLERCFLVKIVLKLFFCWFLSSTWAHVGAMLRPFRTLFELKNSILLRRRFEVDFCTVSETLGPSKMSVSCRREANSQHFVKLLLDVDFWPILVPKRCQNRPQEGAKSQPCTRRQRRSEVTSRRSARGRQGEEVQSLGPSPSLSLSWSLFLSLNLISILIKLKLSLDFKLVNSCLNSLPLV